MHEMLRKKDILTTQSFTRTIINYCLTHKHNLQQCTPFRTPDHFPDELICSQSVVHGLFCHAAEEIHGILMPLVSLIGSLVPE